MREGDRINESLSVQINFLKAVSQLPTWSWLDLIEQPGSGVGPPTFRGGGGDAQHVGGFFNLQPDEITELHQLGLLRFKFGETIESIVQGEQLIVRPGAGDFEFVHVQMFGAGAAALGLFAAGARDEDAAHRFRRCPKEVRAVLPGLIG